MRALLAGAVLLLAAAASPAGVYRTVETEPFIGHVAFYGDSKVNGLIGDYPEYFDDAGMVVSALGQGGAKTAESETPGISVEQQVINDGVCDLTGTVKGVPAQPTCVADITWEEGDWIVYDAITNDTNDNDWFATGGTTVGPIYQTALQNVLAEFATVDARCLVIIAVPFAVPVPPNTDLTFRNAAIELIRPLVHAAIAAANPACVVFDMGQAWIGYGETYGLEAQTGLYDDVGVHPKKSTLSSRGDRGTDVAGAQALAAIKRALTNDISPQICITNGIYSCGP